MAALGRDSFAVPTDDLASDDIVMTLSQGRGGHPSENGSSAAFRVDPALSPVSAAVSTPTSAPTVRLNNLVTERSSRAVTVSTVMPGTDIRHTSAAVIRLVIKRDDKRRFSAIRAGTRPGRKPALTCTDRDASVRLVTRNFGVQVPPPTPCVQRDGAGTARSWGLPGSAGAARIE